MFEDISIFIVPVAIIIGAIVIIFLQSSKSKRKNSKNGRKKIKTRDRNTILKDANRRLAQNPKDVDALLSLGELYFREQEYKKAMRTYEVLVDACATNPQLDEFDVTLKYGLSALKVKNYDEAYKSLLIARSMNAELFEINHNLGYLEYLRKNYEKAASLLSQARKMKPEHVTTLRYLGHSLFKLQRYSEAAAILRKCIDLEPEDKESLFALAQAYHNLGQSEQAVKIFTHLRPDPNLGPSAALYSGTIQLNSRQPAKAVMDFEIGLRHPDIPQETKLELEYRLAAAYIKQQEIPPALKLLQEIQLVSPGYKDVAELMRKYGELSKNRNLQIYLMSPTSDFVTLCRKLSISFFPQAKVKIVDISVNKNDYADILAEISTRKWEDLVLFRFVRTTGVVGELVLRDLYGRIKELRAGRGFCLSAGDYTDGAKQFVEARLIDLIGKESLMKKLIELSPASIGL